MMKRLMIMFILIILITSLLYSQSLNSNSLYIKSLYPTYYENNIRKHAVDKWGTDIGMVNYETNNQVDALIELMNSFKGQHTIILINAIEKWSIDGYVYHNMNLLDEIDTASVENFIKLQCDWNMVKYEYDNQVESSLAVESDSLKGLGFNASYIKQNYSQDYENTIKKHAIEKWETDFNMVVYEINNQSDALVELLDLFESNNTAILIKAIDKWSIDGYEYENSITLESIDTASVEQLIKLHCDWNMVKYEYEK